MHYICTYFVTNRICGKIGFRVVSKLEKIFLRVKSKWAVDNNSAQNVVIKTVNAIALIGASNM